MVGKKASEQQKEQINPEVQNHPTTKLQVAKIWTINSCHHISNKRLTNELETLSSFNREKMENRCPKPL